MIKTPLHRHAQGLANGCEVSDTPANSGPNFATAARNPGSSSPSYEYTTLPDESTNTKYGMPCSGNAVTTWSVKWKFGHGSLRFAKNSVAFFASSSLSMLITTS